MPDLNSAIQLIRQGRKEEGQRILESVIKAEPNNIQAWFWYVETCPTVEKRIQILEVCLRLNPGNAQVTQGLQALKNLQPAQPQYTPPPPVQQSQTASDFYLPPPPKFSYTYEEEKRAEPKPKYFDNTPVYTTPAPTYSSPPASSTKQKQPWEMDSSAYVDNSLLSKSQKPVRSYSFYDVWMTTMLSQDVESYADVLNDPEAGVERAFVWMACAGIVNALVFPFLLLGSPQFAELMADPEFQSVAGGLSTTAVAIFMTVIMLFVIPIANIINIAINGAIQNILAVAFGGNGYYSRTVYALAAFTAPVTIITSILGVIPVAGQCLGALLGFYTIALNVRALRASHSLSTGSAIGVMLAPGILIFIFVCLIIFLIGSTTGGSAG